MSTAKGPSLKRLLTAIRRSGPFLKRINVKPYYLFVPGALSLLSAVFEGFGFGLLVPLMRGLISGDFAAMNTVPVIGVVISWCFDIFGERQAVAFIVLISLVFVSILIKNVLRYYAVFSSFLFVRRFADNIRRMIFERYLGFGKLYFDNKSSGHLYQVLMEMTEKIAMELKAVEGVIYAMALIIVYLLIMVRISWELTIFSICVFPIIYFALRFLTLKIRRSSENYAQLYLRLGAKISNALSCIPLIKAQSAEPREKTWFARASDQVRIAQISIDRKQAINMPMQEIIMISVVLIMVVAIAFLSTKTHQSDVAGYMVFFLLVRRSSTSLTILGNSIVMFAGITGPIREISKVFNDSGKYPVPDGKREFNRLESAIEIRNLVFAYPDKATILNGVSLSFEKGATTAIVGSSGGGKSTLIGLLMRFYDVPPGSVFVDGTDIRDLTQSSWRAKIALVSQESYLFNASIRDNLLYGLQDGIGDEAVMRALEKARLGDLIRRLPQGLDTEIGDRGVKLSGGEKQRISIARAILKQPEIVILDEATSALDSITEKLIQEALNELILNKTTIMVAHRLSTIEHADKVIVLEGGGVVEQGTRQELLDQKSKFYQYWQKQGAH